jgi:hypothetical protein
MTESRRKKLRKRRSRRKKRSRGQPYVRLRVLRNAWSKKKMPLTSRPSLEARMAISCAVQSAMHKSHLPMKMSRILTTLRMTLMGEARKTETLNRTRQTKRRRQRRRRSQLFVMLSGSISTMIQTWNMGASVLTMWRSLRVGVISMTCMKSW